MCGVGRGGNGGEFGYLAVGGQANVTFFKKKKKKKKMDLLYHLILVPLFIIKIHHLFLSFSSCHLHHILLLLLLPQTIPPFQPLLWPQQAFLFFHWTQGLVDGGKIVGLLLGR